MTTGQVAGGHDVCTSLVWLLGDVEEGVDELLVDVAKFVSLESVSYSLVGYLGACGYPQVVTELSGSDSKRPVGELSVFSLGS